MYPMNPDLAYGRSRAADRLHRAERVRLAMDGHRLVQPDSGPAPTSISACLDVCVEACATQPTTVQAA
jgi:hypothetical protein